MSVLGYLLHRIQRNRSNLALAWQQDLAGSIIFELEILTAVTSCSMPNSVSACEHQKLRPRRKAFALPEAASRFALSIVGVLGAPSRRVPVMRIIVSWGLCWGALFQFWWKISMSHDAFQTWVQAVRASTLIAPWDKKEFRV